LSTPATPTGAAKRLAAIDIGSNSIRLLVAEAQPDGSYRVLDDEKRTTRLARGIAHGNRLDPAAMADSLDALGRMKTIADGYGIDRLDVIATSAVREAANRTAFLELVHQRLGLEIEVIPAVEEGRLSFLSAARHFDLRAVNAVVVDLGGGSSELTFAAHGVVQDIFSLPIGAVRLTDALVRSDPLTIEDEKRLRKRVRKVFERSVTPPGFVPQVMIGSGGTFLALANMSMRRRGRVFPSVGGYELDRGEVRHIFEHLRALPLRARREIPGLNADRADIILAGVVVVEQLLKLLGVNRLLVNAQGVRDGLLLRMIEQVFHLDEPPGETATNALSGARQFLAACAFDQVHPEHVAALAGQLFEQLREPLHLPAEERVILEAAALLHEVGYLINYEKHHQHSYHLILHGNVRGLPPRQRELVANVARYHRRSGPKKKHDNFSRLQPAEQQTVLRMSALLRLADGLDRTHTQNIKSVRCEWSKGGLIVHAVAEHEPEVDLESAADKGKLFKKVFGVRPRIEWEPQPVA
jgi:exopolyphosphatase/guanosine-5'-triphosphate,3'-diphosphate pyrophosphatase